VQIIILQRNSWFEAGTHSIAKKKILSSRLWSQLSNFELICLLINCMRQSESFSTVYRVLRQVQHLSTSSTIMASSTFKCQISYIFYFERTRLHIKKTGIF